MLKKIIITLIVLFLLAAAALAYFVVSFDAERFRPLIEQKAAELTGFPLKLGSVSLTWRKGLALEVRGLELKVRAEDESAPLAVGRAYAALEVMPLLRGTLQMGAIRVEDPEVHLIRTPDGSLRGVAEFAQTQPDQTFGKSAGAETTLALLIQNLQVQGGKFVFQDQYGGRVRDYVIDQIELRLSQVSLVNAFPIELKAAVLSNQQNVNVTGRVQVSLSQQEVRLRNFTLTSQLEELNAEKLAQAFPELREIGVPDLAGKLRLALEDMTLRSRLEPQARALLDLTGGRAAFASSAPIENIQLNAQIDSSAAEMTSLTAEWSGSRLVSSGGLSWKNSTEARGSFQASLTGLDLTQALPSAPNDREPGLQGTLSAGLRGTFSGADADAMMNALSGEGQVLIKNPVITNLNVLREVLNKLSIIPGVSQKIQEGLSDEYLAKLQERDTHLEDVSLPLRISQGVLFADQIMLQAETFQVQGQAQGVLNQGPLTGRLFASVDSEFSTALMRSVRELEYIADSNGQITIPLTVRGTVQRPEIIPEVQQIASRLAVAKTQEVISGLLSKKKQTSTTSDGSAGEQGTQTTAATEGSSQYQQNTQPTDPLAALLGQVLQAATTKKTQQQ